MFSLQRNPSTVSRSAPVVDPRRNVVLFDYDVVLFYYCTTLLVLVGSSGGEMLDAFPGFRWDLHGAECRSPPRDSTWFSKFWGPVGITKLRLLDLGKNLISHALP